MRLAAILALISLAGCMAPLPVERRPDGTRWITYRDTITGGVEGGADYRPQQEIAARECPAGHREVGRQRTARGYELGIVCLSP